MVEVEGESDGGRRGDDISVIWDVWEVWWSRGGDKGEIWGWLGVGEVADGDGGVSDG